VEVEFDVRMGLADSPLRWCCDDQIHRGELHWIGIGRRLEERAKGFAINKPGLGSEGNPADLLARCGDGLGKLIVLKDHRHLGESRGREDEQGEEKHGPEDTSHGSPPVSNQVTLDYCTVVGDRFSTYSVRAPWLVGDQLWQGFAQRD